MKAQSLLRFALIASVLVTASDSFAEDTDAVQNAAYDALLKVAEPQNVKYDADPCIVVANTNFSTYANHLTEFREAWFNRDYSIDFYRQREKRFFTFIIVKRIGEMLTETLYRKNPRQDCRFTINATYSDTLGKDQTIPVATWEFNEDRAQKVNWDKIDPRNFMEIAVNYHVTAKAEEWMSSEPSLTDDKQSSAQTCDNRFMRANAIFIRASTWCKKNYMDSPAGYYALEQSRKCVGTLSDSKLESFTRSAMLELDAVVRNKGKAAACRWVDAVEQEVKRAQAANPSDQ